MKKINLIKRLLSYSHEKQSPQRFARYAAMLIMLLTLGVGQMWAAGIDNINYVSITGSFNSWANGGNTAWWFTPNPSSGTENHYTGTFYLPYSSSNREMRIYLGRNNNGNGNWGGSYAFGDYWLNNDTWYNASMSTGAANDQLVAYSSSPASGYIKLECEFYGEYSGNPKLKIKQSAVDALSLTSLDASSSSVKSGQSITMTPNTPGGGSGGYNYAYASSLGGSFDGNTFTAPFYFTSPSTTITVTMSDSHTLLSGLATIQKTKSITINRPDNMYVKTQFNDWDNWGWMMMSSNGDGTYSNTGKYKASTGCNWSVQNNDGSAPFIEAGSITLVPNDGNWSNGDDCTLKLTPSSWVGTKSASASFIRRLAVTATKVSLGTGAGSDGTPSISATSYASGKVDYNTSVTFTAPAEATGYRWKGWYTNSEGTGDAYNTNKSFTETVTSAKTYYAIYEPITYTLTFHLNGGNSWGDLGSATNSEGTVTMSVTYDQVLNGLTMPHAIKNAYHFECWSTSNEWKSQYVWKYDYSVEPRIYHWYEYSGYVTKVGDNYYWKRAGNVDLYAYYDAPTLHNLSFTPRYVVPEGDVTATIRFSSVMGEPEGTYALCYKLMTAAGTALRVQPEWKDKDDAAHTVSFTAPASPGEYTIGIKLFPGSSATWDDTGQSYYFDGDVEKEVAAGKFEVEEMNAVTVSYKSGSVDVLSSTTAYATWSNPATITAPDIPGLKFDNWSFTGSAYLKSGYAATDKTVEVRATGTGTATANYSQGSLFFKDTKGWGEGNIYIYFYSSNYWHTKSNADDPEGTGSAKSDKYSPYNGYFHSGPFLMTKLEGTDDVYYYNGEAPAYAAVAFANEAMEDYQFFANKTKACEVVYVNAFDENKPMIVPVGEGADWNKGYAHYYSHDLASLLQDWGATVRCDIDGWVATHKLKSEKLGDLSFSTRIYLDKKSYNFNWRVYNGDSPYGKAGTPTIKYDSPTSAKLVYNEGNLLVKTDLPGYYTFTITYGTTTGTEVHSGAATSDGLWKNATVTITYPVKVGDYRLIYKDDNLTAHPSDIILKENDGEQIVSMFYDSDATPVLKMQTCTAVATNKGDNVDPITWSTSSALSLSSFSSVLTEAGVYNFTIKQDASGLNPYIDKVEKYTGRFYVRTDCVNSDKWNYQESKDAHAMTYSDYSTTLKSPSKPFSHYFVKDIHGEDETTNIRFTVATDYSEAICDTVIDGDATGPYQDFYGNESLHLTENVRFTYNQKTNKIWRSYTEGPTNNNYMVLRSGSKLYASKDDEDPTLNFKFSDMGNWVYQVDVYAQTGSYVKLTAQIHKNSAENNDDADAADLTTQYFKGIDGNGDDGTQWTKDDAVLLLGGTESVSKEHMRITYDFKTDRMTTAWIPSGDVESELSIHADIMLLRTEQAGATSITFGDDGILKDVKTAYGVMEFTKDYINDYSYSRYARNLYWISFPFDVNLSDVFGFGKYGEHWIIEYYDGKGRASKGYWADSEPNWKFVTEEVKDEFVLNANEGYILALALTNMTSSSSVWEGGKISSVYLYFPSANEIGSLAEVSSVTVEMDTVGYKCNITRDSRNIKDSYWRCIGAPSYAQNTRTGLPTTEPANWETKVPYLYTWNDVNNSLSITSSSSVNFLAMHSYLVQYPDDVIVWNNVTNTPSAVARRRVEGNEASFYEWNLKLMNNGQHIDHTYVRLTNDENVTDGFDFGNDLSKEFNSGSNIYTFVDDIEVGGNVKPISTQTTIVPVGVKIADDGEYTFAMPEGTNGVGVVLIDNIAGTRTNLALDEYTVTLESGTINERFFLEISPIANTPTDVELLNGGNGANGVRKVMVDGVLYIVKDGQAFDARGNRVK